MMGDDDLLAASRMPPFLVATRGPDTDEAVLAKDSDHLV